MRCSECEEVWSFGDEFSPFGLRLRHVCRRCGWVSNRPRWVWLGWVSLVMLAISNTDSWSVRIALTLLLYAVAQLAAELEKLRA